MRLTFLLPLERQVAEGTSKRNLVAMDSLEVSAEPPMHWNPQTR